MENKKPLCKVCGDGYSSENLELGMCCGLPMIYVPWNDSDYVDAEIKKEFIKRVAQEAKNLNW